MDYTVLVGAADWDYDRWQQSFYPEDLPEDWRLGYYGNEFQVVQLRATRLAAAAVEEVEQWVDETQPGFRFLLFLDRAHDAELAARLAILRPKLLALVLPRDGSVEPDASLAELPRIIERANDHSCETHLQAGIGHCWDGHGAPCWGDDIAVVCLDASQYKDLRQLKEVINACQPAVQAGRQLVIIFDGGEAPDVELMHQARTIADLLGF